jgi:hypothetical protein
MIKPVTATRRGPQFSRLEGGSSVPLTTALLGDGFPWITCKLEVNTVEIQIVKRMDLKAIGILMLRFG